MESLCQSLQCTLDCDRCGRCSRPRCIHTALKQYITLWGAAAAHTEMNVIVIWKTQREFTIASTVMASTFLRLVTLFHKHLQSDHTLVWVCSSQFDIHSLRERRGKKKNKSYSAVQYTTEGVLAASLRAVTYLKHWTHDMQNRFKKKKKRKKKWEGESLGRVVADTWKRAEERHFWKDDKPNIPPQPEERNHELAWQACRRARCRAELDVPLRNCVFILYSI